MSPFPPQCSSHTADRVLVCFDVLGLLLKDKETPVALGEGSANTGSLPGIYGLENNELCPACECVLLVMLQLVRGNLKDRFCIW